MTAILNFWRMSTSHNNGSGTIENLDPENMGIAVGILVLCALELEICLGGQMTPHLPANVAKKLLPGQGLKLRRFCKTEVTNDKICSINSKMSHK